MQTGKMLGATESFMTLIWGDVLIKIQFLKYYQLKTVMLSFPAILSH